MEWILPTPTPYQLVEPVQVIEVSSSEEDLEEDPEELPPEPDTDALDLPEDDEDPLPDVDFPEDVMSASEADSTEESSPGGGQRIVTTLHRSKRLLRLGVHTFCGWVYLVQTARFTLLIFGWVDLLYRNFDGCIYHG